MQKPSHDLVIVGGGLAGATLGIAMARHGFRPVIIEREKAFRERIRGELLMPWGVAEAERLGILDLLHQTCGREATHWQTMVDGVSSPMRDLKATMPSGHGAMTFLHIAMQEILLGEAVAAGAEVIRGAIVRSVTGDPRPTADFEVEGRRASVSGRLIVGADGRESKARAWGGFSVREAPEYLYIAGMQLQGAMPLGPAVHFFMDSRRGLTSILVQTTPDLYRVYLMHHKDGLPRRLSGERDVPAALAHLAAVGIPRAWLDTVKPYGPFATFDARHRWIEHPARAGMTLVGDAAANSDPVWGNGLSRTLREVRRLRDRLLEDEDWNRAIDLYAREQVTDFEKLTRLEMMKAELMFEPGPDADARRERVFALLEKEPDRYPDTVGLGPDAPSDDRARARFFGEI